MTKDQVAALAAGKDDVELHEVGRKYGLLILACDFDGVDASLPKHTSDLFTRANPFVHLAIVEGFVEASLADVSQFRAVKCPTTGKPMKVFASATPEGDGNEPLPIHQTLFKGEKVEPANVA